MSASPTFGFKDELISLLTGLVWDHAHNQTLVGAELGGVALLLDCSQIDARNPLITQVRRHHDIVSELMRVITREWCWRCGR